MNRFNDTRLSMPLLFLIVLITRWPALQSWWCLDDWGQLGRAAGIISRDVAFPARWLSQDLWWTLTWPIFGLNSIGHALLRLSLHGIAAVLVARLTRRGTSSPEIGLLAGVLFAITPIAFTVLYWASGIQELLAGVFVLAAAERWWCPPRRLVWPTILLGIASIFAKESGFGLPVLLAINLVWLQQRPQHSSTTKHWLAVLVLLIAVGIESIALLNNFATGPSDPYRIGGVPVILGNIGIFGWWLGTPGPVFTSNFTWTISGLGSVLFLTWLLWGIWRWRRGSHLTLTCLIAALLSLSPSLLLVQQTHPYLAYIAAAALCVTLADMWPRRWLQKTWLIPTFVTILIVVGMGNMKARSSAVGNDGQASDPIVKSAALSHQSKAIIQTQIPRNKDTSPLKLILLQLPLRPADVAKARQMGARYIKQSPRHAAFGGHLGPQLLLGPGAEAVWANSLARAPLDAQVLTETRTGFKKWGNTWQALIYATLTDILLGNHERAQIELAQAMEINNDLELYIFDQNVLNVSPQLLATKGTNFQGWVTEQIKSGKLSQDEGHRLQLNIRRLVNVIQQR